MSRVSNDLAQRGLWLLHGSRGKMYKGMDAWNCLILGQVSWVEFPWILASFFPSDYFLQPRTLYGRTLPIPRGVMKRTRQSEDIGVPHHLCRCHTVFRVQDKQVEIQPGAAKQVLLSCQHSGSSVVEVNSGRANSRKSVKQVVRWDQKDEFLRSLC